MIAIIEKSDQDKVDALRIDLAVAMIKLTEVFVADPNSREAKNRVIERLRSASKNMDQAGLFHSCSPDGKVSA